MGWGMPFSGMISFGQTLTERLKALSIQHGIKCSAMLRVPSLFLLPWNCIWCMANVPSIYNDVVQPVLALAFMAENTRSLYVLLIDDCIADTVAYTVGQTSISLLMLTSIIGITRVWAILTLITFQNILSPKCRWMPLEIVLDICTCMPIPDMPAALLRKPLTNVKNLMKLQMGIRRRQMDRYMMIRGSAHWYATTTYRCTSQMSTPQESSKSMPSPSLNTCLDFSCLHRQWRSCMTLDVS